MITTVVADAPATVIPDWLPVMDGVTVSVAVNVLLPPATVLTIRA